ncbi:MAG: sigma-70 family RNA polymerase sigma factor [Ktedonobacteraceae bacterium]
MKDVRSLIKGVFSSRGQSSSASSVALDAAFRQHATLVYRFIYRRVGNREDAEDLTSVVFLKAVQWLDTERPSEQVQAWLYAAARSALVEYWHTTQREMIDIAELEEVLFPTEAEGGSRENNESRIATLLGCLSERARDVLTLRFLRGYSLIETAAALGMTETNVKVTQHRALKQAAHMKESIHEQ